MAKLDPKLFPDFTDRKVVDRHMEVLDLHGVSRRDFLAFSTASVIASATAFAAGIPSVAVAAPNGKIANLLQSFRQEYTANYGDGANEAAEMFGLGSTNFDGEYDSAKMLNQFEQNITAGALGITVLAPDGASIKRMAQLANQNSTWMTNCWGTLAWFTPFEAGDYYTLYMVPEEFSAHRGVTKVLCETIMEKFGGGQVAGVTGFPGNTTDIARSRGRDAAIAEYPKIELVGQLPGNWNKEASQKATEDLLARFPKIVGIVAQNDDVADGVIAGLKTNGLQAGKDVYVTGADGTHLAATAIKEGRQLATSANVPWFISGAQVARIYDVANGWKPLDAERMMHQRSITMTKDNVDAYLARYGDTSTLPFDYKKMSKVMHPDDWDPQAQLYPLDVEVEWGGIDKPAGWQPPKAYSDIWSNGEAKQVRDEYAAHYKLDILGPSPMKA